MRSRSTVAAVVAIVISALVGGVYGKSALATADTVPNHYQTFTAALTRDPDAIRGTGRIRPDGLQRDQRHAADARSAFELHGPADLRADARAPGRPLLRSRPHHSVGRRRHHRGARVRRLAGVQQRHSPRRRDRDRRRRQRQGLDDRGDGQQAQGTEGHVRQHRRAPQGIRAAARDARDARSGEHPEPVGVVHDRQHDRLRRHHRFRRAHRRRSRRRARER